MSYACIDDVPEIQALVVDSENENPEYPTEITHPYFETAKIAFGIANWISDCHIDTPGDIHINE